MRRNKVKAVRRWIKELHPHVNQQYSIRKNNLFPTDQATIGRYFDWCLRHGLDSEDTANCCLYWGVSEPYTDYSYWGASEPSKAIDCPAIFRRFSVARLEKQFGKSRRIRKSPEESSKIKDTWRVVVKWDSKGKPFSGLKKTISIDLNTYNSESCGEPAYTVVFTHLKVTIPNNSFRCDVDLRLTPRSNTTLQELLYEAGKLVWTEMPRPHEVTITTQKYTYRSRRMRDIRAFRQEQRRRRHQRRWYQRQAAASGCPAQ